MAKKYDICLDIGGTKVLGAVFDQNRKIIYRLKKKTKEGGESTENVEQVILKVVKEVIAASGIKKNEIRAIAAGAPGVIDQAKGIVLFSPNLPWKNYDIRAAVEKATGIPFYIGNDVNVGVLGEYYYGAAKGYHNVVGFFVGTGTTPATNSREPSTATWSWTRKVRCAPAASAAAWRSIPPSAA